MVAQFERLQNGKLLLRRCGSGSVHVRLFHRVNRRFEPVCVLPAQLLDLRVPPVVQQFFALCIRAGILETLQALIFRFELVIHFLQILAEALDGV